MTAWIYFHRWVYFLSTGAYFVRPEMLGYPLSMLLSVHLSVAQYYQKLVILDHLNSDLQLHVSLYCYIKVFIAVCEMISVKIDCIKFIFLKSIWILDWGFLLTNVTVKCSFPDICSYKGWRVEYIQKIQSVLSTSCEVKKSFSKGVQVWISTKENHREKGKN